MNISKLFIVLFVSFFAFPQTNYQNYISYLKTCLEDLPKNNGGAQYDNNSLNQILQDKLTKTKKCRDQRILKAAAKVIQTSADCAKTAAGVRQYYWELEGKRGPVPVSSIYSRVVGGEVAQPRSSDPMIFSKVNLDNPHQDPNLLAVQSGDMLHFDNVNCPEMTNTFHGHVMTILNVRYKRGQADEVFVLEGHTGNATPTMRWLKIKDIAGNALGQPTIGDISCCALRTVTRWKNEVATRNAADAGGANVSQ